MLLTNNKWTLEIEQHDPDFLFSVILPKEHYFIFVMCVIKC